MVLVFGYSRSLYLTESIEPYQIRPSIPLPLRMCDCIMVGKWRPTEGGT
jgi:hypothetical protein